MSKRGERFRWPGRLPALLALLALAAFPPTPAASPLEFVPVGDPLESELRTLDVLGPAAPGDSLPLPRLGVRPLQRLDLAALASRSGEYGPAHRLSLRRLRRDLARDGLAGPEPPRRGVSARAFQRVYGDGERLELSLAAEGRGELERRRLRAASGSGLQARFGVETDRWLLFSRLLIGHVDRAREFADPVLTGTDLIVHSEESYVAYTGPGGRWAVQFGRSRWHWGPGEEASLVLSRTSAPLSGLAVRARIEPLRADAIALSATLDAAAGEQLAAHRVEWQPASALRIGLAETARYRAPAWQPLYAVGALPYVLVQRLQVQDEPDSMRALRNNVMVAADVSWRIASGTRIYAEGLIDDLDSGHGRVPNKYAYQVGWDGAGTMHGTRVVWGGEYTRLTRFVYTSFFGRDYAAQDRPLGFPTGPDARRLRVRADWDLATDWQVRAAAARTDKGENDLDEPHSIGDPPVRSSRFEGVVEHATEFVLGLRWWPASGLDVSLAGGYRWVENAGHVPGARGRAASAALALHLAR